MNYYRRWIGDYSKKTSHLSLIEHGVYSTLLDAYYSTEKPLPAAYDRLYRICGAIDAAEQASTRAVADEFFPVGADGMRHNARADEELAIALATIQAQRQGGKGAADKRWGKESTDGLTDGSTHKSTIKSAIQPSTTNLQPPSSNLQPPTASQPLRRAARSRSPALGSAAWDAYSAAYTQRYGEPPKRNAKGNALLTQLVDRIGADEAPAVAAWYVQSSKAAYVSRHHPLAMLVQDCEGLRTAWAIGRNVSETEARQADRTMATGNAFSPLIDEAKAAAALGGA